MCQNDKNSKHNKCSTVRFTYKPKNAKQVQHRFPLKSFGTEAKAIKAAQEFQKEYNRAHNLSKNDYRYLNEGEIEVKLTHKHTMLVDSDALSLVQRITWCIKSIGRNFYVAGQEKGTTGKVYFHRLLLPEASEIDHINGTVLEDGVTLDNRRENLRCCTSVENGNNRVLHTNNKTGRNGIFHDEKTSRYQVSTCYRGIPNPPGSFPYGRFSKWNQSQAFEEACKYRDEWDARHNCHNGIRKRKQQQEQLPAKRSRTIIE